MSEAIYSMVFWAFLLGGWFGTWLWRERAYNYHEQCKELMDERDEWREWANLRARQLAKYESPFQGEGDF